MNPRTLYRAATALGLLLLITPAVSHARAERAVWTWEGDTEAMVLDPVAADAAIAFAHRQGLQTLYLYADAYQGHNLVVDHAAAWRRLLRRLHHEGLKVHALLGSAFLHTETYVLPEQRDTALAMVRRVIDFNATAAPTERFDAIHLDIEPHQLSLWDTSRDPLLIDFIELAAALMQLKQQTGASTPIGADIPFWLDGIRLTWNGVTTSVAEHVIGQYDFVTLMDYRNRAEGNDGLIAHADANLDIAKRLGRRVIIGVETGEGELPKVTFRGLKAADLERELSLTEAAFQDNPAFAGFAIHHYSTFRHWLAGQGEPQR